MAIALARLLPVVPGQPFGPWQDTPVHGLAADSRRVRPGDLFVALPGLQAHGADFVGEALRRGAAALVLPPGREPPPGVAGVAVADPRAALSALAAAFYGHPSRELPVLGVTGSNGKTTVAYMAAAVLRAAGRPVAYWTTNEVYAGGRRFRPTLTTPEAHDLHRFLREARTAGMAAVCMEVSSHAAALRRVDDVQFAAGVVTGVSPDHLDFHGSFAAYLAAKQRFVRQLAPPAPCLFHADDPGARAAAAAAAAVTVPYGFGAGAALRAVEARVDAEGARCQVLLSPRLQSLLPTAPGPLPQRLPLQLPLPGRHNLLNALAAIGACLALGVDAPTAAAALAGFAPPPRRLRLQRVGPYTLLDDVAMNEASFDAVFATVAELGFPQLVVVVALRGHRGPEINALTARTLARWNRRLGFAPVIATLSRTALGRYPLDLQVRPEEQEAFLTAAGAEGLAVEVHRELAPAVDGAAARLRPGGALLLLGTFGMDEGAAHAARALGAGRDQGEGALPYPLPRAD
jgi:UDP-N-acetylmuramoyl-L-alanyl-D-glutamate--2,6-diaminopimelate ligase